MQCGSRDESAPRLYVEAHALLSVSALPHIGLAAVQHNADILIGKLYGLGRGA